MEAISAFFTDPLRLTLGAAAIVVLVGIFFFGRNKGNDVPAEELSKEAITEALTHNDDQNVIVKEDVENTTLNSQLDHESIPDKEKGATSTLDESPYSDTLDIQYEMEDDENPEEDMFIVLHVVAPEGMAFTGGLIKKAMQECNLVFGDYKIFHYPHPQNDAISLFSVANMLKPGFFEAEKMDEMTTSGISFFMRIPVMEGQHQDVFTTMLATAQSMSRKLGGGLLDEQHEVLTQSGVDSIKQQIKQFEQKLSSTNIPAS